MMILDDNVKVAFYLTQDLVYDLKVKALDNRTTLSKIISDKLQRFIDNPLTVPTQKIRFPSWRYGGRQITTVNIPAQIHFRIKKIALEQNLASNDLVYYILSEAEK
jgi:hypothetical protein